MQPDSSSTQDRIRQIIIVGLIVVGLGLFLGFGGKAMSQINDPSFVYGKQRQQLLDGPGALATAAAPLSRNLMPPTLQASSPDREPQTTGNKQSAETGRPEHKPDHQGSQSNEVASSKSGKKIINASLD